MTKITQITPRRLQMGWRFVEPWIMRGVGTATDVELTVLRDDLATGRAQLWCISHGGMITGAFATSLYDGGFVGVYALGGTRPRRWVRRLADKMKEFARENGAASVRFYGRRAWSRLLPDFSVSAGKFGHFLYEGFVK